MTQFVDPRAALLDCNPDPAWLKDGSGRYLAANQAFAALFRIPLQELVGKTAEEFLPAEMAEKFSAVDAGVLRSGQAVRTEDALRIDGYTRRFDARIVPLRDAGGKLIGTAGSAREVARDRPAENALRESREQLELALWGGDLGLWEFDIQTEHATYSRRALEMLGYSPAEIPPTMQAWRDRVHPEDMPMVLEAMGAHLRRMVPLIDIEYRIRAKSGDWTWIAVRGRVVEEDAHLGPRRLAGTYHIISERKRTEQELEFHNALLAAELETAPDGVLVVNEQGRMVSANRRFVEMWGISEEVMQSGSDDRAIASVLGKLADPEKFIARVKHLYAHPREKSYEQIALLDGRAFERYSGPMFGRNGRYLGRVWYFRDITERRKAETKLRRLNESLAEKAEALAASNRELESFAYTVAHDLRAPLRHLSGFVAQLKERTAGSLDDRATHYLARIGAAAIRMGSLVDDLLFFSRVGRSELRRETVATGTMVRQVIRELEPACQGRSVEWTVGPLPEVPGDARLLRQVFHNLIDNALKYTRPQAVARIEIGTEPAAPGEATFFVRDNGVGFDMKYADKLFRVFHRLHHEDEFEGTGIGLATAARIVERHGGHIRVEATEAAGAKFCVLLPLT